MNKNFDELFSILVVKEISKLLTGVEIMGVDLKDAYDTSMEVLSFDTTEQALIENADFVKAFGIARVKSKEVLLLLNILLLLKKKCKISDFEFQLLLEGLDEENLFGDD